MSTGLDKLADNLSSAIKTVPEFYEDGLKSATQESGKTLTLIPRTINAVLAPLQQWIAQKEYNVAETEKLLSQKLEAVDYKKIVTPEPYVAVPAIQAISYSMDSETLRNLYANLLAKSMNSDTKDMVHPAFVDIIKQLTPNDVYVLEEIASSDIFQILTIHASKYETESPLPMDQPVERYGYEDLTHIVTIDPDMVKLSIDNLSRLRLIDDLYIYATDVDDKIKASPFYSDLVAKASKYITDSKWKYEETCSALVLTTFGSYFRNICINN